MPWIVDALAREIGLSGISWNSGLSLSRVRILVDSLVSTKTYLDMFLKIPDDRLPSLSATQWTLLHYSFMLATSTSLCIDTAEWNVQIARSIIKVEEYFEAMTKRVQTLADQMAPVGTLFDWFGSIMIRWEAMKARYVAATKQPHGSMPVQTQTQTQPTASSTTGFAQAPGRSCELVPEQPWWNFAHPQMGNNNSFMPLGGFDLLNFASGIESWMTPMSYPSSSYCSFVTTGVLADSDY